ncbi:MAG: C25 family cysteine peptidase [Lentimicrobium sp.]|nr:C25 family cysteine peptidase [Lentimicrobium sp.]
MKKALLFIAISFATVALLLTGNVSTAQVVLKQNGKTGISVEQTDFAGMRVKSTLSSLNNLEVNTDKGLFTEISANGYSYAVEEGYPKLPVMRKLIEVPVGASIEIDVVSYDVREYNLNDLGINSRIIPAQAPVAKNQTEEIPLLINNKVYGSNSFYGKELASAEILGFMRGTRMARLDISPVEYNPVSGVIRVYDNLVVNVRFLNGNYAETQLLKEKTRSPYFGGLNATLLNDIKVGNSSRENFTRYPIKYLIVSDPMFQETLQPFIQWKTRKGFNVVEAYTNQPEVGTTTTSIKNYLQGVYNAGTPEDPAPTFVLFVGDVAQIPAFSQGGHVSDLYYCEYTNDDLPEMYYGRFSATNIAQLQPQIDKTLMYEQYQFPDPSFLGECVMISGVDAGNAPTYGNGQINYGTTYYFNEAHGLLSHTYLYPESGSSASAIIQNVSNGVAYGNYTAHGSSSGWADPGFEISDIPGLQNDGKYPLLVGNCCLTSTYNTNCFGEELLRASHKGAVGYIGASNSSYWDEDYYFGVGVGAIMVNPTYEATTLGNYDRAFHDHGEPFSEWYTSQGQMLFAGNLAVTESGSSRTTYYWEIYCLMGDPSLTIYMGVPDEMTVSYEPLMPLQTTEFTVTAEPYAYVAISKDGVLYGSALADEFGVAVVTLNPISVPGDAEVIVTAQNKQPFIGSVVVASPDGPYVMLQSQSVNDAGANNNQLPEYAESFGFNMALKNVGNSEGANITVTLSTTSPYVTIDQNVETWPNIAPGAIVEMENAFEVTASEWLPDQTPVVFNLEITDGTETWNSSYTVKLNAPELEASNLLIDDASGNNNGRLDPGENVIISVPVNNIGHCEALETVSHLFTDSDGIAIDFIEYQIGNIPGSESMNAVYNVSISPDIEIGTSINLYFTASAGLYNVSKSYTPSVGLIIEDFETGDFTAFDWVNSSTIPWTITNSSVNSGTFAAKSGAISHNGSTTLQITMEVAAADNISFSRMVSSESGYDYLKFYIDGTEKGSWSGDVAWSVVSVPVTAGTHTFKWTYSKDNSVSNGQDAAFIDDILFPSGNAGGSSTELTATAFAYPAQLCMGGSGQLFAFVKNADGDVTYSWTPAELLNDATLFNPIATLTESTTFQLTIADGLATANTELALEVIPVPETPVIEQNQNQLISSAAEGNQWYNREGPIEGAVDQIFEPVVSDYYHVVVSSAAGCESEASNEIYMTVVGVETVDAENALVLYPNPFRNQLHINFNLKQANSAKISVVNLLGQEIMQLGNYTQLQSGSHSLTVSAENLKPGIYFIKLVSGDFSAVRKVVLSE